MLQTMFLENDSHFGRHLGRLKKVLRDFRENLVCYCTHISGAILKNSATETHLAQQN